MSPTQNSPDNTESSSQLTNSSSQSNKNRRSSGEKRSSTASDNSPNRRDGSNSSSNPNSGSKSSSNSATPSILKPSSSTFFAGSKASDNANRSKMTRSASSSSQNNGTTIKFDAPLGRDPEKARRVLLEASDDALGVHRRAFVRRMTMCIKIVIFLAFAVTLAYLAQQITSISDLVSSQLSDAAYVRAVADGKPIQAGAVVSFTTGGVQQGHGPSVGVAVTALPCDPEPSATRATFRVFFTTGNSTSSAVIAAAATTSTLTYWMVDSSISDDNNNQLNVSLNTTGEKPAAAAHVALAAVGSSSFNGGHYARSPFMIVTGASSGSSSVYLHLVLSPPSPSAAATTTRSTVLAPYFSVTSSTTDRSTAFLVSIFSSTSATTVDEVAVVGYICGNDLCCIDLVSWSTGEVLSGSSGPRLNIPRCPSHAVHFPSINSSSSPELSHVILPTLPVIVLTINVTARSVTTSQVMKLPIAFSGRSSSTQIGSNTANSLRVRVTSIPPPHNKASVLLAVALFDTVQVFQILPATTTSSSTASIFFIPTLYSTASTAGLSGPISLSGFVFSSTSSWASIYFRDANQLQYLTQVSFLVSGGETSIPRLLPTVGGAEIEFLWHSKVWRHTMVVVRESPKFCGLRSVEWQGGINFAGIAASTVQAGQSVDVYTGGVVRVFAGLAPGGRYSVGVNGSLVLNHDPLALRSGAEYDVVGKAFSKTEMYVFPSR